MRLGRSVEAPQEDSLVQILRDRAAIAPNRPIFHFLDDGGEKSESLTYGKLDQRASAIANLLHSLTAPSDRILLVYPPGLEFVAALFGCFYAGVVAVPCYPPRRELLDAMRPLQRVVEDCSPKILLTEGALAEYVADACRTVPSLQRVAVHDTTKVPVSGFEWVAPAPRKDAPAILQYTSGSTGTPRGVCVSHGNVLQNEYVIQQAFQHRTASEPGEGVCWLPFNHDMGLIGNLLQAVYVDGPCYLMSPWSLLRRPLQWLEAITRYRVHSSGGPGFAYELCVQRISEDQKSGLDLSHWQVAYIGAETISPATIDRFCGAFAHCGFRREAFYPCYGLAEATLMVSGGDKESPPVLRRFPAEVIEFDRDVESRPEPHHNDRSRDAVTLVGCGHAWPGHEILIVDPHERAECPPGVVGEIWFAGPSVAMGYWNHQQESAETFRAALAGSERGPYLRTGDLGLVVDGELFVTGRLKDLIVIRGRNYYPEDIERAVCQIHEAFRPDRGAAFGCPGDDGGERLIVAQEIDRPGRKLDVADIRKAIRKSIVQEFQIYVDDIVLLRNGTLPRTTSGKVRRHETRRRFLDGTLELWKPKPG